jgi:hypothetical protein
MPMSTWPQLDDLVWLFEAEPVIEYEDLGYPTSATTFTTERDATEVECTVEPYMNSLTIRLSERGEERLRLHLWGLIDGIVVDREHGREALVATMVRRAGFHELRIEMRPNPRVFWESEPPWAPGVGS